MGWTQAGQDVVSSNAGNIGIGTMTPQAKLDVNGRLYVEEDLSLLPGQSCRGVALDGSKSATDLGDLLKPYLSKFRCTNVLLKAGTRWTWNTPVAMADFQTLVIIGEGHRNGAVDITVKIIMDKNDTETDVDRVPVRVYVNTGSYFALAGVNLLENSNDNRPLTTNPGGALFTALRDVQFARIELSQIRIITSEDVVSVGSRSSLNILFGHTFIDKTPGSPRDILAIKSYNGSNFGGSYAIAFVSYTTLGAGVTFQQTPKIVYSN